MQPARAALTTTLGWLTAIVVAAAITLSVGTTSLGCGSPGGQTSGDLATLGGDQAAPNDLGTSGPKDFTLTDDIGSTIGIACGDTPCPSNAGQVCCTSTQGKTGTCTTGPAATCGSSAFECDGPEDCPPFMKYCCVASGVAQCTSTACPGTTQDGYGMCHLTSDCVAVGGTCCPSSMGGPYRLCLPNGCQ